MRAYQLFVGLIFRDRTYPSTQIDFSITYSHEPRRTPSKTQETVAALRNPAAMDDEINISPEDLQRLSPNEQRELQVFLQSEQQKNQIAKSKNSPPFQSIPTPHFV